MPAEPNEVLKKISQKGLDEILARLFNIEPNAEVNLHVRMVDGTMFSEAFWRKKNDASFTAQVFVASQMPSHALAKLVLDAAQKAKDLAEED